ncbi:geranylgeranyl reductase family protein [Aciduliprofundum sp. MAR08-339]|uniref:NAD(P)/FAD-dependent oxidoreductase n=1 Tax=Aciduliprofundum sp. (strain MAR08-339) TaxID=673860 RepID=UPI0002A49EC2|nr:geranylgeranyl reductase family protein [Aciduliprofundum sp. MAR08-339]
MKRYEYDVLVIGAGPGGSMAARYAARHGLRVLLVEKRPEIGVPVRCAEGISRAWMDEVEIEPQDRWIDAYMDGAKIYSPDEKSVVELTAEQAGNEVGFVLNREYFDKYLASLAAKEGAEIWMKSPAIEIIKEDGYIKGAIIRKFGEKVEVRAKIVIAADGFESQVARWAGLNTVLRERDIVSCIQYRMTNIDIEENFTHFFIGSCAPGGYVWIFPKGKKEANVGIGVALNKLKHRGEVKKYMDEFIEKHDYLKKGSVIQIVTGAVSTCPVPKKIVDNGIMLVGDAARLIDPITGGGIANACISGKYAGEIAAKCIDNPSRECLEEYQNMVQEKWGRKHLRNWFVKEKLAALSDDTLNKLMDVISKEKITKISVRGILEAVQKKYPELIEEFEDLL